MAFRATPQTRLSHFGGTVPNQLRRRPKGRSEFRLTTWPGRKLFAFQPVDCQMTWALAPNPG